MILNHLLSYDSIQQVDFEPPAERNYRCSSWGQFVEDCSGEDGIPAVDKVRWFAVLRLLLLEEGMLYFRAQPRTLLAFYIEKRQIFNVFEII